MSEFTALYGAIDKLCKQSAQDAELRSVIDALAARPDEAAITRTVCSADGDWMDEIERSLTFVGKALGEERRFIRTIGEVRPIEKIKRVTKESVRHLASHSEFINKDLSDDKDDRIVPDKLYNVERLNDYATYENRFLYTLLVLAKDFISRKISEFSAVGTYKGEFSTDKVVTSGKRCIRVRVSVSEERNGDDPTSNSVKERLSSMLSAVDFYLHSPVMMEVAKSEGAIRTDVTLTNILKMDPNFREAVSLYEYLRSFSGNGFVINSCRSVIEPYDRMSRDFAVPCLMYLMLVREYGSDGPAPSSRWHDFVNEQISAESASLRQIAQNEWGGVEKYLLSLESRLDEINGDRAVFEDEIRRLKEAHAAELEATRARNIEDVSRQRSEWQQRSDAASAAFTEQKNELVCKLDERDEEIGRLRAEIAALTERNALLSARVDALSSRLGIVGDLTDEQRFAELELEYEVLGRLVRKEWHGVKKMMRKQMWSDIKASVSAKSKAEVVAPDARPKAQTDDKGGCEKDE